MENKKKIRVFLASSNEMIDERNAIINILSKITYWGIIEKVVDAIFCI